MADSVSVAVGGTCDHDHERCPACGGSVLHRVDAAGHCRWVFCQTYGCPEWIKGKEIPR